MLLKSFHLILIVIDIFQKIDDKQFELCPLYNSPIQKENEITFKNLLYQRKFIHEETNYLNLLEEIIEYGIEKQDRTGVGTLSLFGRQLRFSLDDRFPLLTTRKLFWKGIVEELLWFIKGSTIAKHLSEKGVKIWDANASREFLDKVGLANREEGDIGPVYGFQWRHWGADYVDMNTDYTNKGFDQLNHVIRQIQNNPNDRRLLVSAWNPSQISLMALPPCHVLFQFYVANNKLSCQFYQRSCDMGLGVPFNIASYGLLTCMIAQICNLQAGELIMVLGDAHVYKNHISSLKLQMNRSPYLFPKLKLNTNINDINSFTSNDIQIVDYCCHDPIQMKLAV